MHNIYCVHKLSFKIVLSEKNKDKLTIGAKQLTKKDTKKV